VFYVDQAKRHKISSQICFEMPSRLCTSANLEAVTEDGRRCHGETITEKQ
jgi:hypothetical protein